jgi:5-methylcytosine-specific restriction endonuclease McrA
MSKDKLKKIEQRLDFLESHTQKMSRDLLLYLFQGNGPLTPQEKSELLRKEEIYIHQYTGEMVLWTQDIELRSDAELINLLRNAANQARWIQVNNYAEKVDLQPEPTKKTAKKKAKELIPNDLRKTVFERDAYRCQICGTWEDLTIDHIVPESKGGATEFDNLQTLCRSCNSTKGTKMP